MKENPMIDRAKTRRRVVLGAAPVALMGLGSACAVGGSPPAVRPAELTGAFDFFVQNFAPTVAIHEQGIAAFKEVAPNAKLTLTAIGFGEMAANATAVAAAGSGPDALQPDP